MHFLAAFVMTLVVILVCLFAFTRLGVPSYRPTPSQIEQLLEGLVNGYTRREEWVMFIGHPIHHDPALENIRLRCLALEEGDEQHPPCAEGINGYLYNKAGRERAAQILQSVKLLRTQRGSQTQLDA